MSANIIAPVHCPISLDFEPQLVNISSLLKTVSPTWTALVVVNALAAPITFYVNLLIIWTVLESERLRSCSYNILIAILALTDLLLGLIIQPVFIALLVCVIVACSFPCQLTVAYIVGALVVCGWSAASLTLLSIERYLAIEHPLYYVSKVTNKKVLLATAVSWIVMAASLLFGRLETNDDYKVRQIPVALNSSVCIAIIVFCIAKVLHTTRRQGNAIAAQEAAVQQQQEITAAKKKEIRRYFTLGIILVASVVLYCPGLIVKALGVAKGKEWTEDFKYISQFIWMTCIHFQSLVNPLIVSLRLSTIRQGVSKKLLC